MRAGLVMQDSRPTQATRFARASCRDHGDAAPPCVQDFASLGGRFDNNIERDMHRWLRHLNGFMLEPYYINLPLVDIRSEKASMRVPIILPSEVLRGVFEAGDKPWEAAVAGRSRSDGKCPIEAFWDNARRQEWFRMHPDLRAGCEKVIPMIWHCDGAEYRTAREMLVFSWASAASRGDTWASRFVFAVLPMHLTGNKQQLQEIIRELVHAIGWQTDVCASGRFGTKGLEDEPFTGARRRFAGQPIAGGWRAVFAGWHGDAKARNQVNFFTSSPTSTRVCDECKAVICYSRADRSLSYGDFSVTAKWKQHTISHAEYMAGTEPAKLSPWCAVSGWHKTRVMWDLMHNLHLGILRDVVGSLLWLLFCLLVGVTHTQKPEADARLQWATLDLHAWCKVHRVDTPPRSFSYAQIGSPSNTDYPELSSEVKAAHLPTILCWLVEVTEERQAIGVHGPIRVALVFSICRFLELLGRSEAVLTPQQGAEAVDLGQRFLDCYQLLAGDALATGFPPAAQIGVSTGNESKVFPYTSLSYIEIRGSVVSVRYTVWKVRPKFHYFQHQLGTIAQTLDNPLHYACFGAEDWVFSV